jgi:ribosome-associated protein
MDAHRLLVIPETELRFLFARSGGPGGQNVQKVETKVTVIFNYISSACLTWEEKGRIGRHSGVQAKLDSDGAIAITSQEHRTQARNKEEAVKKLYALLALALYKPRKRVPTKKTRSSERRRVQGKRFRSEVKGGRKRVSTDSEE